MLHSSVRLPVEDAQLIAWTEMPFGEAEPLLFEWVGYFAVVRLGRLAGIFPSFDVASAVATRTSLCSGHAYVYPIRGRP